MRDIATCLVGPRRGRCVQRWRIISTDPAGRPMSPPFARRGITPMSAIEGYVLDDGVRRRTWLHFRSWGQPVSRLLAWDRKVRAYKGKKGSDPSTWIWAGGLWRNRRVSVSDVSWPGQVVSCSAHDFCWAASNPSRSMPSKTFN